MDELNLPEKKLFFSIGEVAELFNLNESTLRFWESHFQSIRPQRRGNERTYARKEITEIQKVHFLLKERKMTISGAKKELTKNSSIMLDKLKVINALSDLKEKLVILRKNIAQDDKG